MFDLFDREKVPEGGWYAQWTGGRIIVNERCDTGDGDMWRCETGEAMREVAEEICRLHNATVARPKA